MRNHSSVPGGRPAAFFWIGIIVALISGLMSAACSSTETSTTTSPTATATPVARATPAASATAPATSAASNVTKETKNPLKDRAAAAAAGKPLYVANCAVCHGESGKGDAPAGVAVKATDLTKGDVPSDPDGELFLSIKNGREREGKIVMPPAKLTDEQIWQVVAYVRTLAGK